MIIQPRQYLWPSTLAGLTAAVRSVVRVRTEGPNGKAFSTGIVLTPTLLLIAKHASDSELFEVGFPSPSDNATFEAKVSATLESVLEVEVDPSLLPPSLVRIADQMGGALLRLASASGVPPLTISSAGAEKAARLGWIFLLSCPKGVPRVATSIGELLDVSEPLLAYDANSEPGGSGGPIVDSRAEMIGIHLAGGLAASDGKEAPRNYGVSIAALLADLRARRPDLWEEVRDHHKLQTTADVVSSVETARVEGLADEEARRAYQRAAAVLWSFDPAALRPCPAVEHPRTARSLLLDDVESTRAQDGAARWSLHADVRDAALRDLGSLAKMREARAANPSVESAGPQEILDRALRDGAIADWEALPTQSLGWLRAIAGWLGPFLSDLPTVHAIDDRLAFRRLLEPFDVLGGAAHFRDRDRERARLAEHLAAGPDRPAALVVHGAGGSGKSALIGRFVLDHIDADAAPRVVLAYLDFDRAALDARKPAGLFAEIRRQIHVQGHLDGEPGAPPSRIGSREEMSRAAADVATVIERGCAAARAERFLLVLDSFEEVQYATSSTSGAPVAWLDALIAASSQTRVIILGRAPIDGLVVGGKRAAELELGPLEDGPSREVLESWLGDLGTNAADAIDALLKAARGNPLTLRVGAELLARHDPEGIASLLHDMPAELVRGVLYDRVLERIHDPRIRALARPGLVLRRVTPELLREVVAPIAGVDMSAPGAAAELFDALRRETFLAETDESGTLVHRPELRTITLRLIEYDAPDQVGHLDAAAAAHFAREAAALPPSDELALSLRAEELYHRLRLDAPPAELSALWSPGVADRLHVDPDENLPETAAAWLRARAAKGRPTRGARPFTEDARTRERRVLWGDLSEQVHGRLDLGAWTEEDRAGLAKAAGVAAERAPAHGNAPELVRAHLISGFCEELAGHLSEAAGRVDAAIRVQLPLEPVFAAALRAHRAKLAAGGGDEPIRDSSYSADSEGIWKLDEPALRHDAALGRYVHAAWCRFQRGSIGRAMETLGLSRDEADIAELAAMAASGTSDPSRMNLIAQSYGLRERGTDPREQWSKILHAAMYREDGASGLAQLADKEPSFGDAVAALWLRRGRAALYPNTLDAVARLQTSTDDRTFALFTPEQLDALGAAFAALAASDEAAPQKLAASLPAAESASLPVMPSPASQLLSDLRTLSSREPAVFVTWLERARDLSAEGAKVAVPELTRVLRLLGAETR